MKLLLFDIDGTLIRVRRRAHERALREIVSEVLEYDGPVPKNDLHGKTDRQIFLEYADLLGLERAGVEARLHLLDGVMFQAWDRHLTAETVHLLEGVHDLLERLALREDAVLALLTGNLERSARRKLAPHDLNRFFPFGAYGSDAVDRIDLPPIALDRGRALHGDRLEYERTLIIGDSHRDIACAKAWGISVLAVATGSLTAEELSAYEPDSLCDSLVDDRYVWEFLER